MSKLGDYLCRATEYCAETRNLVEDVITAVWNRSYLSPFAKKTMLSDMLKGMGFSNEQLEAFANCRIPEEYQMVPVNVGIKRYYRTWVRVQKTKDRELVKEAAKKQILNHGDHALELDHDLDIEEDDIEFIEVDWDGAYDE